MKLVSAGLALAGDQHGGADRALARTVGESVQNAGNRSISGENPNQYDRNSGERDDDGNQQGTQVRPAFAVSAGKRSGTRLARPVLPGSTTLPSLTLVAVSN